MPVQCLSVVVDGSGSDERARLRALDSVRGLSAGYLDRASAAEASLFGVLMN
eukprot:COSAG04_NODE_15356_length_534_cov_1.085057_2_plen_51_part_01